MSLEAVLADAQLARRGLTREQYDVLVEAGHFEGQPVELLEGVLVEVVPQGWEHGDAIAELSRHLTLQLPAPWRVRPQLPLAASDRSEPEPDIAVTQRTRGAHPNTAALVIEVSGTTQRQDLVHKPAIYAAAAVEQCWVVDVPRREVVVHAEPSGAGYATVRRLPWTAPGVDVDLAALLADL